MSLMKTEVVDIKRQFFTIIALTQYFSLFSL